MKNKKEKTEKSDSNIKWCIEVVIITFILSILFSYISANGVSKLSILPAILILIAVILVGIIADIIAIAVTVANEDEFHAKASKKIKGSKTAIKFIRNSSKVSNFCADVIGDIAGVLSGAISAIIALKLTEYYGMSSSFQFIVSALVASITVSGKAMTKEFAKKNANKILEVVTKIINFD